MEQQDIIRRMNILEAAVIGAVTLLEETQQDNAVGIGLQESFYELKEAFNIDKKKAA